MTAETHTRLAVGQPMPMTVPLRDSTGEDMHAVYGSSGIMLVQRMRQPTPDEIAELARGELRIGLLPMHGGYCWLLRSAVATAEAPYCPTLTPAEQERAAWLRLDPDTTIHTRLSLSIVLIDQASVIRSLRLVSLSPHCTRRLAAMHVQAIQAGPVPAWQWDREIAEHYRRYANPRAALDSATVTCRAGD